jgi:transposase
MGYSNDLRVRVIRVVEGGVAARAAARQFVIGDATAIRWVKRWRETGSFEARSVRGQSRSPLKKHEDCRSQVRKRFHQLDGWIVRRLWSHRAKRWRNSCWKNYPTKRLLGEFKLVNLVSLIPSLRISRSHS